MRIEYFLKVVFLSLSLILFAAACSQNSNRKIKLSDDEISDSAKVQTVSSEIRILPEQQSTIAIFYFENRSSDTRLNWLQRGLTDMLFSELSQSLYLNVVPIQRLLDISQKMGYQTSDLYNFPIARRVARKANVETIISGRFYNLNDSLKIDATLWDISSKEPLHKETVSGAGLEQIFQMVNDLSERMRTDLRGKLAEVKTQTNDSKLTDLTESVEAYRCYSLALAYHDKLILTDAVKCLEKAVKLDSSFAEAYFKLALFKSSVSDYKGSATALNEAKSMADKLTKFGRIQMKLLTAESDQDREKLLTALDELLKYSPYDIEVRNQLAVQLLRMKRYDRALQEYENILDLDPGRKLVYNQIGYIYAYRGDFTNAIKYLQEYHQMVPDEPNPHDSMGEILIMAGRFRDAEEQLKIALEKQPDFYSSAMQLTRVYSELGDVDKAMEYSEYWLSKAPSRAMKFSAYLDRATLLWRYDKIEEAKKTIKLAEKAWSKTIYSTRILGELYNSVGDEESAKKVHLAYFEKNKDHVLKKHWDNNEIRRFIFNFLEAEISPAKLIPVVASVYEREEDKFLKSGYRQILGLLHLRQKEYEKAQTFFSSMDDQFVDLIMEIPKIGWRGWKYVFEIIQLSPEYELANDNHYDTIIKKAKKADRQDIEILARLSKALAHERRGSEESMLAEYRNLGYPLENSWRVIGPFKNHNGFVKNFFPEEFTDLSELEDPSRSLHWQPADDGVHDGYVNLRSIFDNSSWVVGYGLVYMKSPKKRVVQIRLSTDESCKLWFNDDLVWQSYHMKGESPLDNDIVSVVLHQGYNKLLLKVTNSIGDW